MRLKPLRKAPLPPLVREVRGRALTVWGDRVLLDAAEVTSEGIVDEDGGEPLFHGSTRLEIALDGADLGPLLEGVAPEVVRVAAERSIALRVRLLRLARAEVERRAAPRLPRTMTAEVGFAVEDARL